jgi:hypothetical protein
MNAAMYAGFVVLLRALWLQLLAPDDVLIYGRPDADLHAW